MSYNTVIYSLFSGSSGNCYYIKSGNTEILIDAGVCCKAIKNSLESIGTSLENIKAIFITHEHIDHVKGLDVILKKYHIDVYMLEESYNNMPYQSESLRNHVNIVPQLYSVSFGEDIMVSSFLTSHDSFGAVGYRLDFKDGTSFAIATDTGYVTDDMRKNLIGATNVVLESNHDENMLMMNDKYPYILKKRILSKMGHLSNATAAEFCQEIEKSGTRNIMLAHLSKENNYPLLAKETVKAKIDGKVNLKIAAPEVSVLLDEYN